VPFHERVNAEPLERNGPDLPHHGRVSGLWSAMNPAREWRAASRWFRVLTQQWRVFSRSNRNCRRRSGDMSSMTRRSGLFLARFEANGISKRNVSR
jgi:hypothetical protein